MSLSALPAALLQTLMHSLHADEILSLALCCKWTLQCADSAFAWRHCPPKDVRVDSVAVLRALLGVQSPSPSASPLRFRSLSVTWGGVFAAVAPIIVGDLLRVADSFSVVALHVETFDHCGLVPQLLTAPALQQTMHTFTVRQPSAEIIRLAAQLPLLHTLGIRNRVSAADCAPLTSAPSLTSLSLWFPLNLTSKFAPVLGSLPTLRTLSVREPSVSAGSDDAEHWSTFCAKLAPLESLDIQSWIPLGRITQAQLSAGFASLQSLRRLKLEQCGNIDRCLIALRGVPSLQTLVLDDRGPTEAVLTALLIANPLLHVQFLWHPEGALRQLLQVFPQRVTVDG